MKVLQLGKFYPIRGGVEKVMWDLTRGLGAEGVACDMVCAMLPSDDFDSEDKPFVEEGASLEEGVRAIINFEKGGRCICLKSYAKVAATMMSPAMVFWLRRHHKEYDIIHVHHPDPMAALALRLSGYKGKVVLHWHSDILKQKGLLKLYMPIQRWLVRRADKIVGTTPVYVRESEALKSVQDKITYLPIGVEDVMDKSLDQASAGSKIVFSLGRLVGYKGYTYLVDAAKYLPRDYVIVIGGGGPLRDELQAQIDSLPEGSASVKLLGRVPDEELRKWYNSCKVFVLSSIWKTEAFAIVQVEAMSCAKPIVATKIPASGVSWVNEDGVSGVNVPVCDSQALARAIVHICEDEKRYQKFCEDARSRYETLFTYGAMISGCKKIYESL